MLLPAVVVVQLFKVVEEEVQMFQAPELVLSEALAVVGVLLVAHRLLLDLMDLVPRVAVVLAPMDMASLLQTMGLEFQLVVMRGLVENLLPTPQSYNQ